MDCYRCICTTERYITLKRYITSQAENERATTVIFNYELSQGYRDINSTTSHSQIPISHSPLPVASLNFSFGSKKSRYHAKDMLLKAHSSFPNIGVFHCASHQIQYPGDTVRSRYMSLPDPSGTKHNLYSYQDTSRSSVWSYRVRRRGNTSRQERGRGIDWWGCWICFWMVVLRSRNMLS